MYSTAIIKANTKRYEQATGRKLVRRKVSVCREMVTKLNAVLDPDTGQLDPKKRPRGLFPIEKEFIRNEIALCRLDFVYWLRRYIFITHKETGQLILFEPNIAQRVVMSMWAEMEERGLAIAFISVKARQRGISTLSEMAVAHRVQFQPNINAIVGSSDPNKSKLMAKMMETCWDNQPWWMVPEMTSRRAGILIEFGKQNSAVSIQHGTQFSGIARGTTTNCVHLCVAPNTLIRTADSQVVPITELDRGDKVLTHEGKLATVKNVWKSPRTNELTSDLWLWGAFAPLSCTRDHKILTPDGYKEARLLHEGDFVSYPVRPITQEHKEFSIFRRGHGNFSKSTKRRPTSKPTVFSLDRDWGWLCGLYLAEGTVSLNPKLSENLRPSRLVFSIHEKEADWFTTRLKRAIGNYSAIIPRRTNSKTVVLEISCAGLARWINDNFGRTDGKHVPDWAWEAGEEFCKGLVEGYIDGDGHITPESNELYATSVRLSLLVGLRELVASLGCGWSGISFKKAGIYYGRSCQDAWVWSCAGETAASLRKLFNWPTVPASEALHYCYSRDKKFIEIEIDRVADGFSEEFWDVEVDDPSHSFTTLQCAVHNSELADFDNPRELIDASLMGAAHESASLFMALESTAKGRDNWLHDAWRNAKENWPRTRLRSIFLPWFVTEPGEMYPSKTFLKRNPVPDDWKPQATTLKMAETAHLYVKNYSPIRKFLGKDWQMSPEQMWWWECEREEARKKRQLTNFQAETPGNDIEAFQSSNISAFDSELVAELRDKALATEPHVFAFTGDAVSERLYPDKRDIRHEMPEIPIMARWRRDVPAINFNLVPLKFESFQEDPNGRLYIWEFPKANHVYVIGADTAEGIGQDRSVLQVIRLRNQWDPHDLDVQVAEFASAFTNARDLWPLALCLGTYYSTPDSKGKIEQIRQVIECNGGGESVQYELQKLGWWNFHPWKAYDNKKQTHYNKIGWFTNYRTRAMAVDTIVCALRDEWLVVNSPWFVEEMDSFERDESRQSLRAGFGAHDDRIMSMAFSLFSSYVDEITTDGRSFFTARKKPTDAHTVTGIRPGDLTAQLLKESAKASNNPYTQTGRYNPY